MVSIGELYKECSAELEAAGNPDSAFDALCIFQDCIGDKNPLLRPLEAVRGDTEERIRAMVKRRISGEPLQYILGEWEFWGYPFRVGEGVLIPRPDTETLIDDVIHICRENRLNAPRIADLCSGSGCIAITLKKELPLAEVTAVELSPEALAYLRQNAELNSADICIAEGDVLSPALAEKLGSFDIIVSNPPYLTAEEMTELQTEVSREPEMALAGGADGLDFYRMLTPLWKSSLRNGGWLCYEFGMGQHDDIEKILAGNGFVNIQLSRDLGGVLRTARAQKQEENNG